MAKIFKVIVTIPQEHTTEYVVGEKEKDFLVQVFKDKATVELIETDTQESAWGVLFTK